MAALQVQGLSGRYYLPSLQLSGSIANSGALPSRVILRIHKADGRFGRIVVYAGVVRLVLLHVWFVLREISPNVRRLRECAR